MSTYNCQLYNLFPQENRQENIDSPSAYYDIRHHNAFMSTDFQKNVFYHPGIISFLEL